MQFLAQCLSCKFNSPIILVYIGQLVDLLTPSTLHLLEIIRHPGLFHTLSVCPITQNAATYKDHKTSLFSLLEGKTANIYSFPSPDHVM